MKLFRPGNREKSEEHKRIYALYELWYTAVDFMAAFTFLIGSVLFFSESTQTAATWCFVIGSICFALKPTIRLARELRYYQLGEIDTLADRLR
ncbi:YrhK family protein [Pararhizobium haloflavum]|uniref:YrhK family protein n=1 Tax=Pararhizobium haloflavum TaxID=2037914 RepID=UPI000C196327|nr:YrhK family protein [Pararhizobium haloflavum]